LVTLVITDANLILVCSFLAIGSKSLIKGLEEAHAEESRLTARVGAELEAARAAEAALHAEMEAKEKLLRELHHRVHNNMQIVLSLLDIEEARRDDGSIERMTRRVRALSLANDLVLSSEDAKTVQLHHLVAGSIVAHRAFGDEQRLLASGGFATELPIEYVAGLAIALAEVLAALDGIGSPVAVGLERGRKGADRLTFRWPPAADGKDGELAARLCADPVVASLAAPGGLSFDSGGGEGRATLSLALPGR